MSMNNSCNHCGKNPCQCHTTCVTPVACIPPALSHRAKATSVSAKGLIDLIETKCDAETCAVIKEEIDLLYLILDLENHRPNKPKPLVAPVPIPVIPPVNQCPDGQHWDTIAKRCMLGPAPQNCPAGHHWDRVFQKCISNCPEGYYFNGTDCVVSPHPEGIIVPVLPDLAFQLISNMVDSFAGDLKDKYPSAILLKKQIQALWECIYDKQQHHGEWNNNYVNKNIESEGDDFCLKDGGNAIPTVTKVIVPVDAGSTVFHYVDGRRCLFESLVDNNIVEPSKLAVLDGLWVNYCDIKDVIDCVLPRHKLVDCKEACDDPNNDGVVEDPTLCERVTHIERDCCSAADLPAGAVTFANGINGTFDIVHDGNPDWKEDSTDANGTVLSTNSVFKYRFLCNKKTFDPAQYPYLAVAGRKVVVSGVATIGYYADFPGKPAVPNNGMATQWGTEVTVDGVVVKSEGDAYALNISGFSSGLADNFSFTMITTGDPLVVNFCYIFIVNIDSYATAIGDTLKVDMSSATLTFAADVS